MKAKLDWKNTLGMVAPALAAALGGPAAGAALSVLAKQFLLKDKATEEELAIAVSNASPAELATLREIDNTFKLEMEKLGVDVFKAVIDDRKDARQLAKADMRPHIMLSALFVGGYFYILHLFINGAIVVADGMRDPILLLLGVLTAAMPQILQFWFGSSVGSKDSGTALRQIVAGGNTT